MRVAGVDDVLDHYHVPAADRLAQVEHQPHVAGGRPLVARQGDEVHPHRHRQPPRQVGEEDEGAAQHADQQHLVGRRVVGGDRRRQLVDAALDRRLGDQHPGSGPGSRHGRLGTRIHSST
jgi:hypothetical protein